MESSPLAVGLSRQTSVSNFMNVEKGEEVDCSRGIGLLGLGFQEQGGTGSTTYFYFLRHIPSRFFHHGF